MRHFKLLIALLIFCFQGISQTKIQLILTGGNQSIKVYAQDFSFRENYTASYQDTIYFYFTKTNKIDLYNIGCYINDKQPWKQIWLDSGNIRIYAHMDSTAFKIDTVINSPTYDYVKRFGKEYSNFLKLKDTAQSNKFLLDNLKTNIDNPFSLWLGMLYLNLNQNNKDNVYDLKQALSKQGDKFLWFRQYSDVIRRIDNILSVEHLILSDFQFIDKHKKKTSLTLKIADYYVLDFWFLGCGPCRKEHKIILKKHKELQQNKIEVIGISTDKYSSEWKDYLSKNHYYWKNYVQASKNKITETLGINSFPYFVVISGKGDIIGRYNSFSEILKSFKVDE